MALPLRHTSFSYNFGAKCGAVKKLPIFAHPRGRSSLFLRLHAMHLLLQGLPSVPKALTELLPGRLTACRVEGEHFNLAKKILWQVWDFPR